MKIMPTPQLRLVWPLQAFDASKLDKLTSTIVIVRVTDAGEFERHFHRSGLALRLVNNGVRAFALVGAAAEHAHDVLDEILEAQNECSILTSWHYPIDVDDLVYYIAATVRLQEIDGIVAVLDETDGTDATVLQLLDTVLIANEEGW